MEHNEFEIYYANQLATDPATGMTIANGVPVGTRTISDDKKVITYEINEVELAKHSSKDYNLVLLFNKDSSNVVNDAEIKVEYLAQALQLKNTTTADWSVAATATMDFGGQTGISVVPAK